MGRSKAKGGSQWPIEGIHCRMEKDQGEGGGGAQEAEGEAGKEEGNQSRAGEEAQPSKEGRGSLKKLKLQGKKCLKPRRLELEQTRRSLLLVEPVEMPWTPMNSRLRLLRSSTSLFSLRLTSMIM